MPDMNNTAGQCMENWAKKWVFSYSENFKVNQMSAVKLSKKHLKTGAYGSQVARFLVSGKPIEITLTVIGSANKAKTKMFVCPPQQVEKKCGRVDFFDFCCFKVALWGEKNIQMLTK